MLRKRNRAVALVMAVAIMAVLAVIGFGFASSMKLESAATMVVKDLAQARLAAQAALQLFPGILLADAVAEYSTTAGCLADHMGETMCQTGLSQTLLTWGDVQIMALNTSLPIYGGSTAKVRDDSSKLNLNAFGNIALWDYISLRDDSTASGITDATAQLYHGANHRFSSFEVSIEQFLYTYYKDGKIWATGWDPTTHADLASAATDRDKKARVRCANIARAICLYRYGGKKGAPDYGGNGIPGAAGDDDGDNDLLVNDGLDNNGNRTIDNRSVGDLFKGVDEPFEGVDEPDEFNPNKPVGDDLKFDSTAEFIQAVSHGYAINGTRYKPDGAGHTYGLTVPAATKYNSSMTAADISAEALRLYSLLKDELTVYSYNLGILSVSIDDPGTDGYDNDGDGLVDVDNGQPDVTTRIPAISIADIKKQLTANSNDINRVKINEKRITSEAQAAYLYWKLNKQVTYTKTDGTTFTQALVPGFTVQNAVDIVDYRDIDCIPTKIMANTLAPGIPSKDTYGFEGLHITEVGRFIASPSAVAKAPSDTGAWVVGGTPRTASLTVPNPAVNLQTELNITNAIALKQGAYMVKVSVEVSAASSITFTDANNNQILQVTANGTYFVGPLNVDANGKGVLYVVASATPGAVLKVYLQDGLKADGVTKCYFHLLLPYIEIMNMSKKIRDMTLFSVQIGGGDVTPIDPAGLKTPIISDDNPGVEVIMDSAAGTPGVVKTGTWTAGTYAPYPTTSYAGGYWYAGPGGTNSVEFTPSLTAAGVYDVFLWYPYITNPAHVANGVPVDVVHAGVTNTVSVNMVGTGGQWVKIATYTFDDSGSEKVTIRTTGTTSYVAADAVKFSPVKGSVERLDSKYIGRHRAVEAGFDTSQRHGPYYGFFVIAYDQAAFDNYFTDLNVGDRDFPLCVMPSLFATTTGTTGFDGTQSVRLWDVNANFIAGGDVDRFDVNNGTWPAAGSAFSSTALARCRTSCGGNAAYDAFSDALKDTDPPAPPTPTWSPGRAIKCNATCRGNGHKHWPNNATSPTSVYLSDNVDVVTVGDRGHFRSPAEVTKIEVAGKWATTLSLSSMDDSSQPEIRQLPGWVVTGRAPARININTASTALMAAAFCNASGSLPTAATLSAARPYTTWAWIDAAGIRRSISNALKDGSIDDDGDNDGDDNAERLTWAVWFSNVFTLNSFVFTTAVEGQVRSADGTVRATYTYMGVYDRGSALDSDGKPKVKLLSLAAGQ